MRFGKVRFSGHSTETATTKTGRRRHAPNWRVENLYAAYSFPARFLRPSSVPCATAKSSVFLDGQEATSLPKSSNGVLPTRVLITGLHSAMAEKFVGLSGPARVDAALGFGSQKLIPESAVKRDRTGYSPECETAESYDRIAVFAERPREKTCGDPNF